MGRIINHFNSFGLTIGVRFFQGYSLLEIAGSIFGILIFVGIFSLGFHFHSSAISMRMETPDGLQAVITLLTLPLFFASNAPYPIDAFPGVVRILSQFNPLTQLANGVRYFAVGKDFYAIGVHYVYSVNDVIISLLALIGFAIIMFLVALQVFKKAVVT